MNSEQIVAQAKAVEEEDSTVVALAKKPSVRLLPRMPILVIYHPKEVVVSLQERKGTVFFAVMGYARKWPLTLNCIDAHQLRGAFLTVTTPAEALSWFAESGHFRDEYVDGDRTLTLLSWSDFQLWQEFIRLLLSQGLAGVLKRRAEQTEDEKQDPHPFPLLTHDRFKPIMRDVSDEERTAIYGYPEGVCISPGSLFVYQDYPYPPPPVAEITTGTALEAMLATIFVDQITGTKFQICALGDCSRVYEVSSKHERQYCSQACAHKASVRKRRAEAKRLQEEAAKKATKSKAKKGKG